MKKYLLLMLLVLIGMGASASTDEIQLKLEKTTSSSDGWSSLVVTNAGEIKQGDFLIFSFDAASSSDQYAISKTGSLIGVYNINKGYADFKQISILYQNDEYAIVKSNTVYGLNVYDYIVLDASTVNDNEFIYE